MKARIIKQNIINDLRNGGKMMIVKSVYDSNNKCTGLLFHIGESTGDYFLQKNTMVVTDLGFDNQDTINAIEDVLIGIDNVFCCDANALKFVDQVVSTSKRIDKSDIKLVSYYKNKGEI